MIIVMVSMLTIASIILMAKEYKKASLIFWALGALLSLIAFYNPQ